MAACSGVHIHARIKKAGGILKLAYFSQRDSYMYSFKVNVLQLSDLKMNSHMHFHQVA